MPVRCFDCLIKRRLRLGPVNSYPPASNRQGRFRDTGRRATTLASTGFMLILLAGLTQGSFIAPMKLVRKWEWENIWLLFCFLGFIVLPGIVAALTVPQLGEVLTSSPGRSVWLAALFGIGWGCGSVCLDWESPLSGWA